MKTHNLKKGFIPLSIFLLLMLNFIPIANSEIIATYYTGFEDGTVTQQYSNSWITTEEETAEFYINNAGVCVGVKNFWVDEGSSGWWNYTYSSSYIMLNWSALFLIANVAGTDSISYINFSDVTGTLLISLRLTADAGIGEFFYLHYQKHDASWVQFTGDGAGGKCTANVCTYLNISFASNDTVNYTYGVNSEVNTPRNVVDNPRITSVYMVNNGIAPNRHWTFDSHNITIGNFDVAGAGEGVAGYDPIGDLSKIQEFHGTATRYLEIQKNTLMEGYIKAIDLVVDTFYFGNVARNTINDLTLKLNGIEIGTPTSIDADAVYGGCVVRWLLSGTQHISNERILCEFRSLGTTFYVALAGYDVDDDGDKQFINHNQPNYYDGYYSQLSSVNYDLGYRIWGLFETIKPDYEDKVLTSKTTYGQYERIDITVLASTLSYQNYLHIYNTTYTLLDTFPINSYSSRFTYHAVDSGTLHINLTRNAVVVASRNLTIASKEYEYLLYTDPNPSKPSSIFDIKYIYNNTQYTGLLFVYDENFNLINTWYLANESPNLKTVSYAFPTKGIYYFRLVVNISASEKEVTFTHLHHVGITEYANEIKADTEKAVVNSEVVIFGTHNFLGGDVYVKIADEYLRYVGESNEFSFIYHPLVAKEYTCNLIIKISDTDETILDNTNFTCYDPAPVIPPDDIFGIPSEYVMAMGGAFLTLGFLIIPFGVSKGKATNIIYAIFGGIGLGVSTIAGLFPLWLPFMVTILVVAVMIFEYKKS